MQPKNAFLTLILLVVLVGLVLSSVNAETENFTVPPQSEITKSLSLREDDRVSIGFSVVGQSTSGLNFYITDPDGNTIMRRDTVGQLSSSFSAEMTGTYILHFDNTHSSESKTVALNYDIQHYIFGMPQTMFWVFVIIGVSVIAVAVFVLIGKAAY